MKTFTEMDGGQMREVYGWMLDLVKAKREEKRAVPPATAQPPPTPEPTSTETPIQTAPAEVPARIKSPEERYAEFIQRKEEDARKRRENWLKTLEEIREPLVSRIKERFSWSEERLKHAFQALDVIDRKRLQSLRRIVVYKPEKPEEALPKGSQKIDEFAYLAEYLPEFGRPREKREPRDRKEKRRRRGKGKPRGRGERAANPSGPRRGGFSKQSQTGSRGTPRAG
jgi:hypothetical protein